MSEFVMGARLNLVDNFTNPIQQALQATNQFHAAITGANNAASTMVNTTDHMADAHQELAQTAQQATNAIDHMADATHDMTNQVQHADSAMDHAHSGTTTWTSSLGGMKKALLGAAAAVGTFMAVDKLKDFGMDAIEIAASMKAMSSQFGQVFEGMESKASETLAKLGESTGMMEGRLKGSFIQMAAFAKTTGMDTANALELSERATLAAADSAAFYDRSIEDVSENLQSFLKGNYENDAALGISATEFTRNAAAMAEYGKKFTDLSESQKQLTLLKMVEDGNKLSGALGQAALEADAYENVMGNLKQTWAEFKAKVGGPLLQPFVDSVMSATKWIQGFDVNKIVTGIETAKKVVWTLKETFMSLLYDTGEVGDLWEKLGVPPGISDKIELVGNILRTSVVTGAQIAGQAFDTFKTALGWVRDNMETVIPVASGLVAGFAAFKIITTTVAMFKAIRTAMIGYKAAMLGSTLVTRGFTAALRANPIGAAVTAIMLLVAAGVFLYRNWDQVVAFGKSVWAGFLSFWNTLWTGITTFFTNIWNNIKMYAMTAMVFVAGIIQSKLAELQAIWDFVWSYLSTPVMLLVEYVKLTISNFMAIIQGLFTAGMELLKGDWEGAWNAIKGIGETIMNNIMSFFGGINLFDTGKQIIQGLIDGFGSMIESAKAKVQEVAGGIKDAVTGFFDINSPSRLFRTEVGQQLGAGWILGMEDSRKGLIAAASSMSEAATVSPAAVQEMQTTARVATAFEGTPTPNYAGGTAVPAAGNGGTQQQGGGTTTIGTLVGKIELAAGPDTDAQALLEQFMKLLYERLRQAQDILSGGDKGVLL